MSTEIIKGVLDCLIGETIESMTVTADSEVIEFVSATHIYTFDAVGDCCSHSWIEHMEGQENLYGTPVVQVIDHEKTEYVDDRDAFYSNHIKVYKYTIKTAKGDCDIEMRNESNGFYGGWLQLRKIVERH